MRDELVRYGLWPADDPRDPSEDFAAAFIITQRMQDRGWKWTITRNHDYTAGFERPDKGRYQVIRSHLAAAIAAAAVAALEG